MAWKGPFIAVDWGTTNRRAWRIAPHGAVEDSVEDDRGVTAIAPGAFAGEIAGLRATLGDLPMLMGGMVGSDRGWHEVPYVPSPASISDIAAGIMWVDSRTGIVPGVCQREPAAPDVMRGEEVQIIGALASGDMSADALVCLPGTHAKWVQVSAGRIAGFATWMTGEIFALLARHSILAPQMQGTASPGPDFVAGVANAAAGDPLAGLFRLRAAALLGTHPVDGPSYASGLLIGGEVRAALAVMPGGTPHLIGRPDLCALYAAAIAQLQGDARVLDGAAAFRAGIRAVIGELP